MSRKNVVVFVHGIGKHDKGWALNGDDSPRAVLEAAASQYTEFEENPLSASVEYEEIRYDNTFETVRDQWVQLAQSLADSGFDGFTDDSVAAIQDQIGNDAAKFAETLEEDKFATTHALDALLYKGFDLVANIVRHDVAAQLARIVSSRFTGDRTTDASFTIVAHSLGTAVVYDALQLLTSTRWLDGVKKLAASDAGGGDNPMLEGGKFSEDQMEQGRSLYGSNPFRADSFFDWRGLVMISNVSRIMNATTPGPYANTTKVRPIGSGANGCLQYYINVDHVADPTAKLKQFRIVDEWPMAITNGTGQDVLNLKHFYDKNIHGFGHYLINPRVHARVMYLAAPHRVSQGFRFVRKADQQVISGGFSNFGGELVDDLRRNLLEEKLAGVARLKPGGTQAEKHADRIIAYGGAIK